MGATPVGLASEAGAPRVAAPVGLASEAALHRWRPLFSSGFQAGEAVGGPIFGAYAVVDEEKAAWIVLFFDRF